MSHLYGADWNRLEDLIKAFTAAKAGNVSALKGIAKSADFPGFNIDDVLADLSGPKAGQAFRILTDTTCRGAESLGDCDVAQVHAALAALLQHPSNGCPAAAVAPFLPPMYDGSQRGKGKLGALSMVSQIVHRGSPMPGSGVVFTIENPEVPELFGELSPTEIKYDGTPEAKLVRRFYDFVEAMMIVGEGGYQVEEQ